MRDAQMYLTLAVGLLVGSLVKLVLGKRSEGIFTHLLLGLGGASIAAVVGQLSGAYTEESRAGLLMSALGATALLLAHVLVIRRKIN